MKKAVPVDDDEFNFAKKYKRYNSVRQARPVAVSQPAVGQKQLDLGFFGNLMEGIDQHQQLLMGITPVVESDEDTSDPNIGASIDDTFSNIYSSNIQDSKEESEPNNKVKII